MAVHQNLDLKVAICGTWYKPQPVVFVPAEEADTVRSEGGNLKLLVTREESEGRPKRSVTLTNRDSGFTATGSLNLWYSRINWGNGSVWRKTAAPQHQDAAAAAAGVVKHELDLADAEGERATGACCDGVCNVSEHACGGCGGMTECSSAVSSVSCDIFDHFHHLHYLENACPTLHEMLLSLGAPVVCAMGGAADAARSLADEVIRGEGQVFSVEVVSARGLTLADSENCQVTCLCELQKKEPGGAVFFTTPTISSGEPVWNCTRRVEGCAAGDSLAFTVVDNVAVVGKAVLTSDRLLPGGFKGELPLGGAGEGAEAFLSVEITPENELAGLLSAGRMHSVFEMVREDAEELVGSVETSVCDELESTVNKWLPQAMHAIAGKDWTEILQLLTDETKDMPEKARQLSAALRDAFCRPLKDALTQAMGGLDTLDSNSTQLVQLIIQKVVEEIIETTTSELDAVGLDLAVEADEGLAVSPGGDAGQAAALVGDAGQNAAPGGVAGQAAAPGGDAGQAAAPGGVAGQSAAPGGDAGQAAAPGGVAGQAVAPGGAAGQTVAASGNEGLA